MSAARAADVVAPPEFSWTGFHIGAGGGAGWNLYDAETEFCHDDTINEPVFQCGDGGDPSLRDFVDSLSADDLGAFYGLLTVEAGFDYDFGGFVLGILGNYDFNGDNDAEAENNNTETDGDFTDHSIRAELDDTWFLGARAGFTTGGIFGNANNTSLIYVLGGYTWANGKAETSLDFQCCAGDHSGDLAVDEDGSVDGWTLGGGIETMIWDAVSLKLEYRHDFLDDIDWDVCDDEECGQRETGKVDFSRDTVRAVLSWRFGSWW